MGRVQSCFITILGSHSSSLYIHTSLQPTSPAHHEATRAHICPYRKHTNQKYVCCIPRYTCVLNIRCPMHTRASMPVNNGLQHCHCSFIASVRKVLWQACSRVFQTSVRAYPEVQICSSTRAPKLRVCWQCKFPSTFAAKLQALSQRNLDSTQSIDRTRSFAAIATIVEASTHSSWWMLRYARIFTFFFLL